MSDYEKRIEGMKAVEQRFPREELRQPTHAWAGLALSKSSPFALETSGMSQWTHRNDHSPYKTGITTSIIDSTPLQDRQLPECSDIHTLMTELKLAHYIRKYSLPIRVSVLSS